MKRYRCSVCGYIHQGEMTDDFKCPKCKQPRSAFVLFEEEGTLKNRYKGTKTEKNLLEAFSGESQARNKYTYFADVAQRGLRTVCGDLPEDRKKRTGACPPVVAGARSYRLHQREPACCCRRRELRMDRYVRPFCQRSGRRRVSRTCREVPSSCSYRKSPRRKVPQAPTQRRDAAGFCQRRRDHVGVQSLRSLGHGQKPRRSVRCAFMLKATLRCALKTTNICKAQSGERISANEKAGVPIGTSCLFMFNTNLRTASAGTAWESCRSPS